MKSTSEDEVKRLSVELGERSYPIIIGEKLMGETASALKEQLTSEQAIIVTDENVARYYLHRLTGALAVEGINSASFVLPAGESTKCFEQLSDLLTKILEQKPDRKTMIFALGGGVIGDIAGVAASMALRGLPFIQIPTSLLAQVDSSVGGKTGINTPFGKNTLGSFYQPKAVLIDTTTLQTLPKRELLAGYAEIIKYGLIHDEAFYDWLFKNGEQLVSGDAKLQAHAISTSCQIKAEIVASDELEQTGRRALLNFGHTYAHALELEAGYGNELLHGEAVAIGMIMALKLSEKLGHVKSGLIDQLTEHFTSIGLRTSPKQVREMWNKDALMKHLKSDKKAEAGKFAFILSKGVGEVWLDKEVPEEAVYEVLSEALR